MQLPTVSERSDTRRWVVAVIAAAAFIICCGAAGRVRAQAEHPSSYVDDGRIWYEKYCTPCHGLGGGPGSAVFPDSDQSVDLRRYVQRHGGNFPSDDWFAVLFGPRVSGPHSAVWEKIRTDEGGTAHSEIVADGIVAMIADYVISIQAK
jgi:hypothetical protein